MLALSCSLAHAVVLECPINAPTEWKLAKSRLDRARVLGPSSEGVPEKEWQQGGTLYQAWNMKPVGRNHLSYRVDCLYTGTARFIRFDARSVGQCVGKRRVRMDALMAGSMEFRCR
ncbi:MAG: hypothetical protein WCC39_08380 [Telluria sp.]